MMDTTALDQQTHPLRLRPPQAQLAGCCWLPRIVDKTRAFRGKRLPLLYRLALGSSVGLDGAFLRHFRLTLDDLQKAVAEHDDDAGIERWFRNLPATSSTRIGVWNERAPLLGSKGHPGYLTRHLIKFVFYPKSVLRPVNSLFEAIAQDEAD
ncbi:MAG: DUF5069 domain-containing protein [Nitrospiraceae bacterium]